MTSSSECEILQNSQIIRDRWKIKQKLGGGGFGEIYEAIDLQSHNERVAVKVESAKATKQVLKMEVAVLRRLQGEFLRQLLNNDCLLLGKKHACKFYGCGRNDRYNYLVMSLQGKNLADPSKRISKTMLFGFNGCSSSLANISFNTRNPCNRIFSNFAMGRTTSTMKVVYMLDFGLARLYLNARNEIRSPRLAAGFRGTVRYAAVSAHKNKEMGRQDDLWSLFYMLVEFLQGALPWRRIKDKDEVGRMKEEANIEQLLDGCPFELLDFPKHLKTLGYPDEPNYDLLERCLWSCMARLGINMDDPYDWEIGYENVSGRSKTTSNTATNGNISTRMRSHTTAVRDRGPDDKNRAMDTQAPITMGEDEDEQTGNNFKFPPPLGNSVKSSQDENADKPKYKRQEFMRPKYGAVSFDVIDAVNARLAAADSNGQPINGGIAPAQSNEALFSRMRIETSVENAPQIYGITRATVEATIEQPPANQEDKSKPSQKSLTLSAGGKRYQNGSKRNATATCSTNAIATENPNGDTTMQRKNQTIVSRWQDSFDDSVDDDAGGRSPMAFARNKHLDNLVAGNHIPSSPTLNGDLTGFLSPRSNRRLMPSSKSTQPLLQLGTQTNSIQQQNGTSNGHLIQNGNRSPGPFPNNAPPALHRPDSPKQANKNGNSSPKMVEAANVSEKSGGFFKSLVHASSNVVDHLRKRSFSRGASLDETRQRQQYANSKKHGSQKHHQPQQQQTGQASPLSSSSGFGSQNANDVQPLRKMTREEEEREVRRQRRLRRRSDCQSMFPTVLAPSRKDTSLSPTRSALNKTVGNTMSADQYAKAITGGRFMGNGVNDSSSQQFDKSASCRRKRYQFLSFAPRAMSRS
ncbi:Tau-tubulin kinase 1 [Aphelenchoides bicaudatus]|nr:Tau-tubulin kinase 1 [Aphelenchoides bicaudatus]